ncbi:hypothetical protein ACL3DF_001292 [Campylobacter lari]|uniref:hypothetical protein n=1 Tax=Campylobacter lari TaxID=201 RepID=UPI002043B1EA
MLFKEALEKNEFIPEPMQNDKSKNLAITLKNSLIDEVDFILRKWAYHAVLF